MSDTTYFSSRGCYYLVNGSSAPSGWSVSPAIPAPCPVLYQGGDIQGRDNVAKSVCFNDVRVAAATGKDFGTLSVQGIALLGSAGNSANFGGALRSWFQSARLSKSGRAAMFSSSVSGSHSFLAEWYTIGNIDPQYNILNFGLGGACLD